MSHVASVWNFTEVVPQTLFRREPVVASRNVARFLKPCVAVNLVYVSACHKKSSQSSGSL